jgi:hypothetical protein
MTTEADLDEIYRLIDEIELPMPADKAKSKLKNIATAKKMLRLGIKEQNQEIRDAGGKKTTKGEKHSQIKQSLESLMLTIEKIEADLKAYIDDPENAIQFIAKRQQQEAERIQEEERQFQERLESYRQEALRQEQQKLKDGFQGSIVCIVFGLGVLLFAIFARQLWLSFVGVPILIIGVLALLEVQGKIKKP